MERRRGAWLRQAGLAALLVLPGCESIETFYTTRLPVDTAVDWWHQLQGGVIADERPPPPGVTDPYPNLAAIPGRPVPTDAATRRSLSARLAAERDRTERMDAQTPIVPPTSPSRPATPPAGPAVAPLATARMEAASAPALPAPALPASAPAAPAPAPASPPAPPPPAAIQAAAAATPPPRVPTPGAPVVSGPVPPLPGAAPPLPSLDGIPAATTAPATPRPRPQMDVAFLPASAVLRPDSDAALRQLAARRAGGAVALLGGGDAASAQPDAQAAALPLAWRRARAMADVLAAAGVPATAMHMDAAALARGGIVRLLD